MTRYLAWIEPVTPEVPGSPPGIWGPTDPRPTPPIYWPGFPGGGGGGGGSPPGIWGGGNAPMPTPPIPIYPGGTPNPPGYWGPPGPWPTPPIHFPPGWVGGVPPGIWGPTDPRPGWGLPESPPGTWGGAGEPFPGWGLPPPDFKPPGNLPEVPEGKALVILFVPGEGFKVAVIPKPGPGYNPPEGGSVPQPIGGKK